LEGDELMTPFVYDEATHFTLKSLFAKPSNKILAVAAKRGLLEEPSNKFMILNFVNIFLS